MTNLFADHFAIQRELGRGSFGVVHLALDTRLGNRPVALKVLHPALNADPQTLALFENEAGLLAGLDHDHIVTVYDAGVWQNQRYIVMRYVDGPTLAEVVRDEGAQEPERVAAWLRQAADLRGWLAARDQTIPTVVAGDFNSVDDHSTMRDLYADGFHSAANLAGAGFVRTWPANRRVPPLIGIDHILVDGRLTATAFSTFEVPGTDHLGVQAVVAGT